LVIITQDELFYLPIFFKKFLSKLNKKDFKIEYIISLPPLNESMPSLAKKMYEFYGPINFVYTGCKYVILKIFDRFGIVSSSIRNLSKKYGIKYKKIKKVNDPELILELKKLEPDIIVSVSASQIFSEKLLNIPKWGCINIHSAKLPHYRGVMPSFWVLYHGEKKTGITIHTMDTKIDRGKIILQEEIEIYPSDSYSSLVKRSKLRGADLMVEALNKIKKGTVNLREYTGKGSYYSFPTKEEVKIFKKRGRKLL